MKFAYREVEKDEGAFFCEAVFIENSGEVILALRVKRNTIDDWRVGLEQLQQASHFYLQNLLAKVDMLESCAYDDLSTLWRIIFALRSLVQEKTMIERLSACLQKWFSFEAYYSADVYKYLVYASGELILSPQHLWAKDSPNSHSIPASIFSTDIAKLQKEAPDKFSTLLQNYERLLEASTYAQEGIKAEEKGFAQHSFANFSRALIDFLDKNETVHVPIKIMNSILSVAVKDENVRFGDQQAYLGRILESRENERHKHQRCMEIALDVRGDVQGKRCDVSRLVSILSAMSAYYLRRYDFERAIEFWNLLDEKEFLLRQILNLYGKTGRYVILTVLSMVAATLSIWLNAANVFSHQMEMLLSYFPLVVLLPPLVIIPVFAVYVFVRFIIVCKGPEYIEMFFPRLLGAIIVGLSVLLFQDTSWKFGMELGAGNLILINLIVYPMALLYIFINVHKELRYLPYDEDIFPDKKNQNAMMKRSIQVSLKVFGIGLLESFFAVLITSSLFYPAVIKEECLQKFVNTGMVYCWPTDGFSVGFFPAIIFLWTGLALLIGAFAQLLWQDKQITSA